MTPANATTEADPTAEDSTAGAPRDVWDELAERAVGDAAAYHRAEAARLFDAFVKKGAERVREWRRVQDLAVVPETLDELRGVFEEIHAIGDSARPAPEPVTLGALAAAESFWARIRDQRDAMPTGVARLNELLGGGLQAKRLVVLLGGPGAGKTAMANQMAEHIAAAGRPVLYLALEDGPDVLLAKTIARLGSLDYGAVLEGRESLRPQIDATLAKIVDRKSARRLAYLEEGIDGRPVYPDALREIARAHFARYGAEHGGGRGLLVVDYLQRWARALRAQPGEKRELRELVSWLTERLRLLARELDCCVLTLSSQHRASGYGRNGGDSALASAKESGDIEYTADVVMAICDDEKRSAPLRCKARTLRLDKNRQGELGAVNLDWRGDRQQWTEAKDQ